MPQHSSRLGGDTHPGAGSNLSCDPRRRNAWLGERAGPASRAPGAAIAAVARGLLDPGEGLRALLDPADVRLVAAIAALHDDGAPAAALNALSARALRRVFEEVRLDAPPASASATRELLAERLCALLGRRRGDAFKTPLLRALCPRPPCCAAAQA
ncbi:hypothetical protein EMIHUDRAFT_220978 [Emiliania huxleyi CCMP1516]|uniref:Uncharacterized protein n=2 Tax=Emiliania huxleyi TaxID=2903 RepID=A0A0D3HZS4_EMIH1|nr:hypothetical protein EMIHUDRAFT_220978 [Emiliania huxleyi CCMP1516]EOD04509.1 hypothetical protein EMIHUDRAFT_220978 [Emiliania huxleyi CCMP1516]|eukprot:XP_005756938.1 hypothetical protein EMIHUDRAFT_220978 [Emiliania huxleyi CCMP1516]